MDFQTLNKAFQKVLHEAPREIAVIAQQHFEASFDLHGYNEEPFVKWKERKNPDNPKNKGRAILIKSNTLGRSIRIKSVGKRVIIISSDVEYAKIHNEGGTIKHPGGTPYLPFDEVYSARKKKGRIGAMTGKQMTFLKKDGQYPAGTKFTKPHNITLPKRQFIGENNRKLTKKIDQYFEAKLKQLFK
jgi:phage gpG-like protein